MADQYQSSHSGPVLDQSIQKLVDLETVHDGILQLATIDANESFLTSPTYVTDYNWIKYSILGNICFVSFHVKAIISNVGDSNGYAVIKGLPYPSLLDSSFSVYELVKSGENNYPASVALTVHSGKDFVRLEGNNGMDLVKWSVGTTWVGGTGFYFIQS